MSDQQQAKRTILSDIKRAKKQATTIKDVIELANLEGVAENADQFVILKECPKPA